MKRLRHNRKLDPMEKEQIRLAKFVSKWLIKNYGKPCKKPAGGCSICIAWSLYDLMIKTLI